MNKVEVLAPDALSLITKAEIDMQISTAKAFPRSVSASIDKALSIATISQEVAESCVYALPRAGKKLEGPSVRLAEIVASSFGNVRTGARVIANDGKTITAQGICHDLETNNCVTVEVKRKITDKNGNTFNEDMQVVTGNAACAIAFRNAVFKVIPAALIDTVFEKVKTVARGTAETLEIRRTKAVEWFNSKGVNDSQICELFDIKKIKDIDIDMLSTLSGYKSSIVNDGAKIEDIFIDKLPAVSGKEYEQIIHGVTLGTTDLEQSLQNFKLTPLQVQEIKNLEAEAKKKGGKSE